MAGPWEKYANGAPADGPWAKYQQAAPQPASAPAAPESAAEKEFRDFASMATQNPAYAQYTQLPEWQKPIVAAGDIASNLADSVTLGFGDKAAAAGRSLLNGQSYDQNLAEMRRQTEAARQRSGWAGTAAELIGAGGVMKKAGEKGLKLAGRFGSDALTGIEGLLARTGLMAGEGAGYGALSAAGHDQDIGKGALAGAAFGAGGNVLGEGLSKAVSKAAGAFNPKSAAPLSQARLNANKNAAYDLAEKAGVIITPKGMQSLKAAVDADLGQFGYDTSLHPGAKVLKDSIDNTQGGNVTLKGLDTIRKKASNVGYIQGNKANNEVVRRIVGHIDDLEQSNDPSLILGLNTTVGQKAMKIAREYASRSFKLETANNLIKKGNIQADRNITDTRVKSVKSQLAKINDPFSGWGRGYNAAEKEAAAKAARYTAGQRALHGASVLNPFGGGKLSAAGHLMAAGGNIVTGNIPGLALQGIGIAAGAGFQKAGEALANKSVREFVDLVARGGVPAPVVKNALQRLSESKREAIARLFMTTGIVSSSP